MKRNNYPVTVSVMVSVDTLESLLATLAKRWRNWQKTNPADPVSMNVSEAELLRGGLLDIAKEAMEQAASIEQGVKNAIGIPEPDSRPRYIEPGVVPCQPKECENTPQRTN